MTSTIQQRTLKNSVVGYLSFIIGVITNILSVPIILIFWGNESYGIWLALLAGVTILKSLDLGHITFIGNEINLLYHKDIEKLKLVLGSSIVISILLGGIQLIICLVLIFINLLDNVLGISPNQLTFFNIKSAFLILLIVWLFIGSFGGILHRLFIPTGFLYQSQWWGILFKVSQFLSIIVIIILGGNILHVAIGYSVIQIIVFILSFIYLKNKIPKFYPWWAIRNFKVGFINFKKSLILSINSFIQQLSINGIVLFISFFFTSSVIPAYTTIRTLTNTAGSISNISVNVLLPDIVRYHTKRESYKIKQTIYANWLITGFIINIGIVVVLPFIKDIFIFWTREQLEFNLALFLFLASSISIVNFGSGLYLYLTGINNLPSQTVITFTRVIIIFSISYLTINIFNIAAIGFGILLSELIASGLLPIIFVNKELKKFGATLDYRFILVSVLPPLILITLTILILSSFASLTILVFPSLLALIITYYFNWMLIDDEVKFRLKELLKGYMRKAKL